MTETLESLRALVDILQGAILVSDMQLIEDAPAWAKDLTPQQRVLMGVLIAAYPRGVPSWELNDRLPRVDHVVERCEEVIRTQVSKVRKVLGYDAIETVQGGYRLGPLFRQQPRAAA